MSDPKLLADPLPTILRCNSINLLAGASGIGKTALLSDLLRRIELGRPIFGHAVSAPPAIGYFATDRSWEENRHWFDVAGITSVRTLSLIDDDSITLPNQRMKHLRVSFFKECITKMQLPPGSLLIVDPIALFLGGNLLDYDTCAFACIEIQRWLKDPARRYCVVGVCHSSKQKGNADDRYTRLQDRISGSMAQLGFTSTQMYLAGPTEIDDEQGRYTFLWNPHIAPGETFQFHRDTNGLFLLDQAEALNPLADADPDAARTLSPFEIELLALLPANGTPLSTHDLIQVAQASDQARRRRVFRGLQKLQTLAHVVKLAHGCWARHVPAGSALTPISAPAD